jgi:hypothetical protein
MPAPAVESMRMQTMFVNVKEKMLMRCGVPPYKIGRLDGIIGTYRPPNCRSNLNLLMGVVKYRSLLHAHA